VALIRANARSDLLGAELIGDARDEATLVRAPDGGSTERPHWSSAAPSTEKVGLMSKISWPQVSALALAAFFVAGSLSNIFAPPSIYAEYLRWGYPH
jgi:hypothetical protein